MSVVQFNKAPDMNMEKAKKNNTVGQIIKQARVELGLKQVDIAQRLYDYGLPTIAKTVGNWEAGINVPSIYQMIAIGDILGIYNLQDLTGMKKISILNPEGEKLLSEFRDYLISTGRYKIEIPEIEIEKEMTSVRTTIYTVAAGINGSGAFIADEMFEDMDYPSEDVPANTDFAIRISGRSMEPRFLDGQIVYVQNTQSLDLGEVGIFSYNGLTYIKKYSVRMPNDEEAEKWSDDEGNLLPITELISLNADQEKYCPILIENDSFHIFGRVLG